MHESLMLPLEGCIADAIIQINPSQEILQSLTGLTLWSLSSRRFWI